MLRPDHTELINYAETFQKMYVHHQEHYTYLLQVPKAWSEINVRYRLEQELNDVEAQGICLAALLRMSPPFFYILVQNAQIDLIQKREEAVQVTKRPMRLALLTSRQHVAPSNGFKMTLHRLQLTLLFSTYNARLGPI